MGFAHIIDERGDAFKNGRPQGYLPRSGHVSDELADKGFTSYFTRAKFFGDDEIMVSENPLGSLSVGFHMAVVPDSLKSYLPSSRSLIL